MTAHTATWTRSASPLPRWRAGRRTAAILAALLATAAGVGWLYLLRGWSPAFLGPGVAEALPLQRLAHESTQPLLKLVAVWGVSGLTAGVAIAALTGAGRRARAALAGAATLVLLLATGAMSDAVTASESLSRHISAQPTRSATWLAAALVALGAFIAPSPRR